MREGVPAAMLTIGVVLTGCQTPSEDRYEPPPAWDQVVESALERASEQGASDAQLRDLRAAQDQGELTFPELEEAVGRSLSCMRSADIPVIDATVDESAGYPRLDYAYGASSEGRSAEQTDALAQECLRTHSLYVETIYTSSPQVREARDVQLDQVREELVSCLEEAGLDVMADAEPWVLRRQATDLLIDDGTDCLVAAGLGP